MKAPFFACLGAHEVVLLAVMATATSASVGPEPSSLEMVQQVERARTDALRAGDVGALQRTLGSDYSEVDRVGRVHTRQDAIAMATEAPRTDKARILIRDNAAIVICREGDIRVMRVWIREDDTWHLMAQQSTPIQPGAPARPADPGRRGGAPHRQRGR
jgi:hypothetical protein